jgi:hypothetical protein
MTDERDVYEVQCSYPSEWKSFDGTPRPGHANARYTVLAPGIDHAMERVRREHPDCDIHQVIKRSHGIKVLIA